MRIEALERIVTTVKISGRKGRDQQRNDVGVVRLTGTGFGLPEIEVGKDWLNFSHLKFVGDGQRWCPGGISSINLFYKDWDV